MIIPAPLPGELDRSYLGRVMRNNSVIKAPEMNEMMAQYVGLGGKSRREAPCLELLSKIAQVDTLFFARAHSTLPYRRGITSYFPNLKHGSLDNRKMLSNSGMTVSRPGAYCCPDCVKTDLIKHGTSYWHREHQLPGIIWCPEHNVPLCYTESEEAFLKAPEQVIEYCRIISNEWVNKYKENQYVNRFMKISFALLKNEKPVVVKSVSAILKNRAAVFGFQTHGGRVKAPLLSDAIVDAFGKEWIATVLPTLADKSKGEILSQLDGVLYLTTSASSVASYILALAYLFEAAEDALSALKNAEKCEITSRVRNKSKIIESEELLYIYYRSYGRYSEVAKQLEISYAAVSSRLRGMGLPNLKDEYLNSMEKAALAFFIEEKSLLESAKIGNVTCDVFENMIRVAASSIVDIFQNMKKPPKGRGSGVRRPILLTPHEVESAKGRMAIKFSSDHRYMCEC